MPFWNFYTFSTYTTYLFFFSRFTTYLQFTINPNIVSLFWYQSIIYRLLLLLLSYNHIMIAYCVLKKKTMQWNLFHESYVCIFLIFFFSKKELVYLSHCIMQDYDAIFKCNEETFFFLSFFIFASHQAIFSSTKLL